MNEKISVDEVLARRRSQEEALKFDYFKVKDQISDDVKCLAWQNFLRRLSIASGVETDDIRALLLKDLKEGVGYSGEVSETALLGHFSIASGVEELEGYLKNGFTKNFTLNHMFTKYGLLEERRKLVRRSIILEDENGQKIDVDRRTTRGIHPLYAIAAGVAGAALGAEIGYEAGGNSTVKYTSQEKVTNAEQARAALAIQLKFAEVSEKLEKRVGQIFEIAINLNDNKNKAARLDSVRTVVSMAELVTEEMKIYAQTWAQAIEQGKAQQEASSKLPKDEFSDTYYTNLLPIVLDEQKKLLERTKRLQYFLIELKNTGWVKKSGKINLDSALKTTAEVINLCQPK